MNRASGVKKDDIDLRIFDEGFYLVAKNEGTKGLLRFGLYVQLVKAIAKYETACSQSMFVQGVTPTRSESQDRLGGLIGRVGKVFP